MIFTVHGFHYLSIDLNTFHNDRDNYHQNRDNMLEYDRKHDSGMTELTSPSCERNTLWWYICSLILTIPHFLDHNNVSGQQFIQPQIVDQWKITRRSQTSAKLLIFVSLNCDEMLKAYLVLKIQGKKQAGDTFILVLLLTICKAIRRTDKAIQARVYEKKEMYGVKYGQIKIVWGEKYSLKYALLEGVRLLSLYLSFPVW